MLKVIVLLGAACVWLLAERHSLRERMTTLEGKIETVRRQKSDVEGKLAALEGQPVAYAVEQSTPMTAPPKNWLQDRIENGSLIEPSSTRNASRSHVRPRDTGVSSGTAVYYGNTYIVAPRPAAQPALPPPPAKIQR